MKKIALILTVFVMVLSSCSKDEEETPNPPAPVTPENCFDLANYTDQLPNLDFEEWGDEPGSGGRYQAPCGGVWATSNAGSDSLFNNATTSKTTDAQNGSYAVLMETKSAILFTVVPGNLFVGKFSKTDINLANVQDAFDFGMPFSQRPVSFTGFYKYLPGESGGQSDSAHMVVMLTKYNSLGDRDTVGFGEYVEKNTVSSYSEFTVPISYNFTNGTATPDSVQILFLSSKAIETASGVVGSKLFVDNCKFNY